MRKLIPLILVILLAGGYAAYWHGQANDFRGLAEQSITEWNAQAKELGSQAPFIKYDALNVTGFPFAMRLEVSNPVLTLPVSGLMQKYRPQTAPAIASSQWVEEMTFKGKVTLAPNFTGNIFTLSLPEERGSRTFINQKLTHETVITTAAPSTCTLGIEPVTQTMPWKIQPVFAHPENFASIFRSAGCDARDLKISDKATQAALFTLENMHIDLSNNAIDGSKRRVVFSLRVKNAQTQPAMDDYMNEQIQLFNTLAGIPTDKIPGGKLSSSYGPQNAAISILYEGPIEASKLVAGTIPNFKFTIREFVLDDTLLHFDMKANVQNTPNEGGNEGVISLYTNFTAQEAYDRVIAENFTSMLNATVQTPATDDISKRITDAVNTIGAANITATLIPKLHAFGDVRFDVEATYKNLVLMGAVPVAQEVKVNTLALTSTPYGLTVAGENKMDAGKFASNFTLTCTNCDTLITDAGTYALRVDGLMQRATLGARPMVSPQLVEGVRQFIHAIATNGTDKDALNLTFTFVTTPDGQFTLSGKPMVEILQIFAGTIGAPFAALAPAQAPVPTPPPQPAKKAAKGK